MNMQDRNIRVPHALLVVLATMLPQAKAVHNDTEVVFVTEEGEPLPENVIHVVQREGDDRYDFYVMFDGRLRLIEETDEGLRLQGGNAKLEEVMEIEDDRVVSLQSLTLLFAFFGPESVVQFLMQWDPDNESSNAPSVSAREYIARIDRAQRRRTAGVFLGGTAVGVIIGIVIGRWW